MSLDDVSRSTKISVRMLQAVEEEHFDRLPGGVFNKGFIRAYARCLQLNEEQAVADYLAAAGPSPAPEEPQKVLATIASQKTRTRKPRLTGAERIPWGQVAVGLLVVAFGFAVWGSYKHSSGPSHHVAIGNGPEQAVPAATPQQPSDHPLSASFGSIGSGATQTSQPNAAGTFVVLVKANADSWLDITADGRDFMHDTLLAGHTKSIPAHDQVVIKAGNAGGLELWFNGKKLTVPGAQNEVRTLTFTPSGLQPRRRAS